MLSPTFPPALARMLERLPSTPPSLAFCQAANRLLWPLLRAPDRQPLVGRRYAIRVRDLGLTLRFRAGTHGFAPDAGPSELTVSACARDFLLLMARREDPDTLFFSRRLTSEGDIELGLVVKNLLDGLDPDAVFARLPAPLAALARRLLAEATRDAEPFGHTSGEASAARGEPAHRRN